MCRLTYVILCFPLFIISIPLVIFATLTTTLAFSTLFFRVLIVYAELAAALIQDQFAPHSISNKSKKSGKAKLPHRGTVYYRRSGRRSSTASGSSHGGESTPKAPEMSGLGVYGSGDSARDFEGVGGWRLPGSDDDESLWTNMNSRLELPTMTDGRQRHHHRSQTSGSMTNMPLPSMSPTSSRARTPTRGQVGRPSSPEEYFRNRPPSKSTTSLDTANIGRSLLRHKPSNSSGSSHSSVRTLHLTGSNG